MSTPDHDCKECKRQLEKLMKKVKREIIKADKLIQNSDKANKGPIFHEPTKEEKKQILDVIKRNSSACCELLKELTKHRTEVKYLECAFNKLMTKFEKLKTIRENQLEQVKNIHYYVHSELAPKIKVEAAKAACPKDNCDFYKSENEKFEKTFEEITSQSAAFLKEYNRENEKLIENAKRIQEEDKQDNMLFSCVVKCIRRAYNIRANIEGRPANTQYFPIIKMTTDDSGFNMILLDSGRNFRRTKTRAIARTRSTAINNIR